MAHEPFNRGLNALLKYTAAGLSIVMLAALPGVAHADENGISFWVPGFFGSLAATPQQPGPSGWNAWITFAVSPPAPGAPPTTKPVVRKYSDRARLGRVDRSRET